MNPFNELRAGLCALAKRSVGLMGACANEESTKLYLALPLIGLIGFDYSNPYGSSRSTSRRSPATVLPTKCWKA
jgi:hypothetical protein